jgi:hypothetical protein
MGCLGILSILLIRIRLIASMIQNSLDSTILGFSFWFGFLATFTSIPFDYLCEWYQLSSWDKMPFPNLPSSPTRLISFLLHRSLRRVINSLVFRCFDFFQFVFTSILKDIYYPLSVF